MYLDTLGKHFAVEGFCDGLDYKKPNDYDSLKTCFIRILYFGDFKSWVKEEGLPPLDPPKFLTDLKNEFDKMADLITEANPNFAELIVFKKKDNEKGNIVSWFLQEYERRILEQMFDFLHRSKQIKNKGCVLCFDGIMIPLNDKTKDPAVVTELLHACEAYILKHTGFNIDLKAKPVDNLLYTVKLNDVKMRMKHLTLSMNLLKTISFIAIISVS